MLVVLELKTWLMDYLKTNDNMCFPLKKHKKMIKARLARIVIINEKISKKGVK